MKLYIIHFLCFLLTLPSFHAIAQYETPGHKEILKLKKDNVDTIVVFNFESPNGSMTKNMKGRGEVVCFAFDVLWYVKDGDIYTKQVIEYCIQDCETKEISVSKPIKIPDRKILNFLVENYEMLKQEEIHPYLFQSSDGFSNKQYYETIHGDHLTRYRIRFIMKNENFGKSVTIDDLELTLGAGYQKNLNFYYNNQTKLKEFFRMLEHLAESLDSQYEF